MYTIIIIEAKLSHHRCVSCVWVHDGFLDEAYCIWMYITIIMISGHTHTDTLLFKINEWHFPALHTSTIPACIQKMTSCIQKMVSLFYKIGFLRVHQLKFPQKTSPPKCQHVPDRYRDDKKCPFLYFDVDSCDLSLYVITKLLIVNMQN